MHFRSGIGGDSKVTEAAEELVVELDDFDKFVRDQINNLETSIAQVEQYHLEVQQLRRQIVQVEQQLRTVLSPTYLPHDRDQAVRDQQVGAEVELTLFEGTWRRHLLPSLSGREFIPFRIGRRLEG